MNFKPSNLFKLVLVSLFFVIASCSKNDDKSDETPTKRLNSYDIMFVKETGSSTIRFSYAGSETSTTQVGQFKENVGNHGALTLDYSHSTNVIKGGFVLTENGSPLNLDYQSYPSFEGSLLELRDSSTNRVFKGVSGTVIISNRSIAKSSNQVRAANYIAVFSGEFELLTDSGELIIMTGTGTIEAGQPIP